MIRIKNITAFLFVIGSFLLSSAQNTDAAKELMRKSTEKYKAYKSAEVAFTLTTIRPKLKPEESDAKYTSIETGKLLLKGVKFAINLSGHEVACDGKTIWAYSNAAKEIQINDYEESENVFSPSNIFKMYNEGYLYQIREKKVFQGKNVSIIEMTPSNKKVSYFKIDIAIEESTNTIMEIKIYEKNGTRYIYTINKFSPNVTIAEDAFIIDTKEHPGAKVVDLR